MSLYEIIKSLQDAQGSLAKQAILDQHKDNELLKTYMKAVYDPGINYYQSKVPKGPYPYNLDWCDYEVANIHDFTPVLESITKLSERQLTGGAAQKYLFDLMCACSPEGKELLMLLIDRKIGANVGDTMVLKTWPDLYFLPPYQRCSLMDDKAKERFSKIPKFYVQTKADGSFAYLVHRLDGSMDVITRQGSKYPQEFAKTLCRGLEAGKVVVGELEVFEVQDVEGRGEAEYLLDRKTGNGILNSALKDGVVEDQYKIKCVAWDMLTQEEFEAGKSVRPYHQRLAEFKISGYENLCDKISLIYTEEVTSLEEAYAIYTNHTSCGLEGCIAKDPNSLWKDGTAKDIVKMKLKFEAEYRCTGIYEGEGKAKGMLGGINVTTEDGLMEFNCGTGFNDALRKQYWASPSEIVGRVVMLSANDIIQSRDTRKKPALSLPAFEEVRFDKTVANTLPEVEAILKAAKEGK